VDVGVVEALQFLFGNGVGRTDVAARIVRVGNDADGGQFAHWLCGGGLGLLRGLGKSSGQGCGQHQRGGQAGCARRQAKACPVLFQVPGQGTGPGKTRVLVVRHSTLLLVDGSWDLMRVYTRLGAARVGCWHVLRQYQIRNVKKT